ncbi:hypothetical protein HRJ34_25290 [Rhizorhabdus wittichii]|uniref:Uncharacterized protein n=1 Tax=Rhizorhabdus wittichii TaxID=160791 RepID=A0A975HDN7_9SPHN|nr:hypothetical protein [Rhizorhabdus wittichii]QTH21585.1 hypothetical protein HRJ34_25290 [Rhizorhabdus wittichii]
MDEEERADLVARLFVLMTCKLEDAAGDAADGQGKGRQPREQIARADRIELIARDIGLLAEAAAAILREQPPDA